MMNRPLPMPFSPPSLRGALRVGVLRASAAALLHASRRVRSREQELLDALATDGEAAADGPPIGPGRLFAWTLMRHMASHCVAVADYYEALHEAPPPSADGDLLAEPMPGGIFTK